MHMMQAVAQWEDELSAEESWPAEVQFVLSALNSAIVPEQDRRALLRLEYRVRAMLRLFSDGPDSPPWRIYARNINERAMGFVGPDRLPLGFGGIVMLPGRDGLIRRIPCTILRCREASPGWFDSAVYFNRPQVEFRSEE